VEAISDMKKVFKKIKPQPTIDGFLIQEMAADGVNVSSAVARTRFSDQLSLRVWAAFSRNFQRTRPSASLR